ncbi:MAG TPA: type VI secretion system tip protein TssI/VgrG, partial [Polyangiaceae bacterium]|nr:type VI secretion system tip protein TssI/VgrG [Polyangiaceae bacterium]
MTKEPDVDFDTAIGAPATFTIRGSRLETRVIDPPAPRVWSGVCSEIQQLRVEPSGLSTYSFEIVPRLWLLTRRTNHRIFQYKSEVEIAIQLLSEWSVRHEVRLDANQYPKRKYKAQYGETDYDFVNRMLEECGVSYFYEQQGDESVLIVTDAPEKREPRAPDLEFHDEPNIAPKGVSFATSLQVSRVVSSGALALRDHDYRLQPSYKLYATATAGTDIEKSLEVHESNSGMFLFRVPQGDTPVADAKGPARTDERAASVIAVNRLAAMRADASRLVFETNASDISAGTVVRIVDHPRADVESKTFLITEATLQGSHDSDWQIDCVATSAATPYRPPLRTPAPTAFGTESATVVGPAGEEIHVDEFGRVKCHFHWNRESQMDDDSSCWIHVSQGWSGAGFGSVMLPRIGQEVLVEFLGGDPDRPIVTGRVYTNLQKVPYGLPANKTQSGIKTHSSPTTGGYNELMFEDKAGAELLRMQAERDKSVLVKRNRTATVGVNCSTSVGSNSSLNVGANRSVTVGSNRSVTVGKNDSKTVGAAQNETIGATKSISAGSSVSV